MSVEKTYQPGDHYGADTRHQAVDLEAKYKALGCAAVRAAASFKPRKTSHSLELQMVAALPQESD